MFKPRHNTSRKSLRFESLFVEMNGEPHFEHGHGEKPVGRFQFGRSDETENPIGGIFAEGGSIIYLGSAYSTMDANDPYHTGGHE
jgi:hypothetical protein